ncbi:hypothetical protein [Rhizobium lentis]|uniref:Uncharacterized protein n=1 Tax=Rhizobium lentis TaxID=1138194 RepID=A0A7W8XIH4_9HYPH|nr:hypothetical protein [Rhizobium lentis]MBB4576608.1 hypothetical protein [Rhizobium lentis]MBB5553025.1 hypothetical protein [Rhizobium lentis]MBB5563456.1 hypothetical protein [Rhizobium lentis]MBB5569994.1 hypothetical protein [Rhizobium lentis]
MDTTTAPQPKRKGRVPKDPNCPKNAAKRAAYHRKMLRLKENPEAYQERLDRKAAYQRAYRQTEAGYAVVKAAEERWQAAHPEYARQQYQTVIRPQVVKRIADIINRFDSLQEDGRLGFVESLCDDRHDDYITMFAMQWAAVRDRIVPYLVQLREEDE